MIWLGRGCVKCESIDFKDQYEAETAETSREIMKYEPKQRIELVNYL